LVFMGGHPEIENKALGRGPSSSSIPQESLTRL
jgi:hypothetical protein